MNFDLRAPCANCPFRTDITFYLGTERVAGICKSITTGDATFSCHKTTKFDDDGHSIAHRGVQHCGGALIFLERLGSPNQMMRIAKRLRFYDRSKLRMDAPVFESPAAMIDHYRNLNDD